MSERLPGSDMLIRVENVVKDYEGPAGPRLYSGADDPRFQRLRDLMEDEWALGFCERLGFTREPPGHLGCRLPARPARRRVGQLRPLRDQLQFGVSDAGGGAGDLGGNAGRKA